VVKFWEISPWHTPRIKWEDACIIRQ